MATEIEDIAALASLLSAPRAIALVYVPWSPWPRKSRVVLGELEASQVEWSTEMPISFFVLSPEKDETLNAWYEGVCSEYSQRFVLHGDGYGPFWWLSRGKIIDCLTKPYDVALKALQMRSINTFEGFGTELA
jgi:hypothetical protein